MEKKETKNLDKFAHDFRADLAASLQAVVFLQQDLSALSPEQTKILQLMREKLENLLHQWVAVHKLIFDSQTEE